jgi:hypothetical protein
MPTIDVRCPNQDCPAHTEAQAVLVRVVTIETPRMPCARCGATMQRVTPGVEIVNLPADGVGSAGTAGRPPRAGKRARVGEAA